MLYTRHTPHKQGQHSQKIMIINFLPQHEMMRRGTWIIGRLHYLLPVFFLLCVCYDYILWLAIKLFSTSIIFMMLGFCTCVCASFYKNFEEIYYLWWKPKCFFILRYITLRYLCQNLLCVTVSWYKECMMKDRSRPRVKIWQDNKITFTKEKNLCHF